MRFEEFAASRWTRMVRVAVLMGSATSDAEDVAQDAMLRCHRSWGRVSRARDLDAYTTRILMNCLIDRTRQTGRRPEVLMSDVTSSDAPYRHPDDASALVDEALDRLTFSQRQVLVLRFYLRYSEVETAEILGVAPGTIKSRTARSLRTLNADPSLSQLARRSLR